LLGAWFLGERATRADWLAIGIVFWGMGLFFCDDLQFAGFAGNLIVLAAITIRTLRSLRQGLAAAGPPAAV
jgi:drug/metabolite transporter (DMT)-like permease